MTEMGPSPSLPPHRTDAASEPLYGFDGTHYLPGPLTIGPWNPSAQHGGPPAGLMATLLEGFEGGDSMFLARTTVELLRPVPLAPLVARVRLVRPGKKVQLVEASLWANGSPDDPAATEVVRAIGLRLRRGSADAHDLVQRAESVNADVDRRAAVQSQPGTGVLQEFEDDEGVGFGRRGFHADAVELRFSKGGMRQQGPGTMWGRLLHPIVGTEPARGVPLAVALSDFGNAVSSVTDMDSWSFINADLTVSLHREPVGEWICLDAVTHVSNLGVGLASSALFDEQGPIGRAAATLLLEPRNA